MLALLAGAVAWNRGADRGLFRREWRYALDRVLDIDQGTAFIIPVAIDDTPELTTLTRRFREINITRCRPAGRFRNSSMS